MSELIIIEPDRTLAEHLGTRLAEHAGVDWRSIPAPDLSTIERETDLRAVVIGPGIPSEAALEFGHRIAETSPILGTILVADEVPTELLRLALRFGLSDVIITPGEDLTELQAALDLALERTAKYRVEPSADAVARQASVLTVIGTKGGVGKSVVASNVAIALAQMGKSTVLVDLDLYSGDLAVMLSLKPTRTIADAAVDCDHLDEEMLRGFLVEHVSGLHVLLAPTRIEDAAFVTVPRLARILGMLANMFEFVVIDTPALLSEGVLTAVDHSDLVFIVATPDVSSVKEARMTLRRLQSLGHANTLIRLVLNRADSRVWLEPAEVERAVGLAVSARIPSHAVVPRSSNKGVPVVMEAPRSPVARSLVEIATRFASIGGKS